MKEKIFHGVVCFFATLVVALAMFFIGKWPSILCGLWFATGLAFGYQARDPEKKWKPWNIFADGVGVTAAVILLWVLR